MAFSVEQLMTGGSPSGNQQFKPVRPSIIQSDPKFTGGLNFAQIRHLNSQQQQQRQPGLQNVLGQQRQFPVSANSQHPQPALANDLSLIEPTLPYTSHQLSEQQQIQQQQQLQYLRQQQVNHNLNVQ